jgi:predicted metal-binding protein
MQRTYIGQRGGYHLLQSLLDLRQQWTLQSEYKIEAVECLSGCHRSCVIALAAPKKTTEKDSCLKHTQMLG